ncbi:hypothetical protein [Magnetofaba australis]|uniref:hypothetical protein n=1 Tax=Magnetofaba australis TaxID=1472297 RepID=UPI00118136E6|nr:hypothetical protein [Magnetofaba australis]
MSVIPQTAPRSSAAQSASVQAQAMTMGARDSEQAHAAAGDTVSISSGEPVNRAINDLVDEVLNELLNNSGQALQTQAGNLTDESAQLL